MPATTGEFNPYQKWFGVRCEGKPDHYRLLGLAPFEDDGETICHAAEQRLAYVRGLSLGDYQDIAQRVLNELAAAKVCLLAPEKKAMYDRALRARQSPASAPATVTPQPPQPPVAAMPAPPKPCLVFPAAEPNATRPIALEVPLFHSALAQPFRRPHRRPVMRQRALLFALLTVSGLMALGGGTVLIMRRSRHDEPVVLVGKYVPNSPTGEELPVGQSAAPKSRAATTERPATPPHVSPTMPPTGPAEYLLDVVPPEAAVRVEGAGAIMTMSGNARRLTIAAADGETSCCIRVSCVGFAPKETLIFPNPGESKTLRIALVRLPEFAFNPSPPEPDGAGTAPQPPERPRVPAGGGPPIEPATAAPRLAPAFDVVWCRVPGADIAWEMEIDLDERIYAKRGEVHARKGLRPACVAGYNDPNRGLLFAAVWLGDGLPAYTLVNVDGTDAIAAFGDKRQPGYTAVWLDLAYEKSFRFSQVFAKLPKSAGWWHCQLNSEASFQAKASEHEEEGYRLVQRRTRVSSDGRTMVRGLWISDGNRSRSEGNLTAAEVQQRIGALERGWRPSCLDVVGQGDARRYTLVITDADPQLEWQVSTALSGPQLRRDAVRMRKRGYSPGAIAVE
ncbi:MAG TPA: hypothetical protein PK867_09530 [Pirellulales bacterium]|nr:hypothetical protein [Pirellulales bacterium]